MEYILERIPDWLAYLVTIVTIIGVVEYAYITELIKG